MWFNTNMEKIYTHENRFLVWNMKGILETAGIDCQIRNEYAGGGVGDLSPFDVWPEIWVAGRDAERARALLAGLEAAPGEESEWRCGRCGEINDAAFEFCWQCGFARKP